MLAGSCGRYSSTHRVAVTATDTFDYIDKRCNAVLATPVPVYGASGTAGVLQAAALREERLTESLSRSWPGLRLLEHRFHEIEDREPR